jgi:hypothetical protein
MVPVDPVRRKHKVRMEHTFDLRRDTKFGCREVLYVSDECTESHYKRTNAKNKGMNNSASVTN